MLIAKYDSQGKSVNSGQSGFAIVDKRIALVATSNDVVSKRVICWRWDYYTLSYAPNRHWDCRSSLIGVFRSPTSSRRKIPKPQKGHIREHDTCTSITILS